MFREWKAVLKKPTFIIVMVGTALIPALYNIIFLSSIVMLEGKSWGRTLYIVIGCLSVAIGFIDGGYADKDAIRSLIKLCILGFFLYRPIINEYFNSSKIKNVQSN